MENVEIVEGVGRIESINTIKYVKSLQSVNCSEA